MNPAKEAYGVDAEDVKYWARRGSKTAAFLLVIPGSTIIAVGIGLMFGQLIPTSAIGFGAGLLIWGLVVALTD